MYRATWSDEPGLFDITYPSSDDEKPTQQLFSAFSATLDILHSALSITRKPYRVPYTAQPEAVSRVSSMSRARAEGQHRSIFPVFRVTRHSLIQHVFLPIPCYTFCFVIAFFLMLQLPPFRG